MAGSRDGRTDRTSPRLRAKSLLVTAVGLLAGLGALVGLLAQTPDGTPGQILLFVVSAAAVAASVLMPLVMSAPEPRPATSAVQPLEPAGPSRLVAVHGFPADRRWADWIAAALHRLDGVEVLVGVLPDALPGPYSARLLILSAVYDTADAPARAAMDRLATGSEQVVVLRVEPTRSVPGQPSNAVLDIQGLVEADARLAILAKLESEKLIPRRQRGAELRPVGVPYPAEPPLVSGLPPRAPYFLGREAALRAVFRRLIGVPATTEEVRGCVLAGLGGVGKTSIAVEYVRRFARRYSVIWWIPAERSTTIRERLVQLAELLGVPRRDDSELMIKELWPALRARGPWLIVLDNVEPESDITTHWPPPGGPGQLLMTSRLKDWSDVLREEDVVPVDVHDPESAALLLRQRTPLSTPEDTEALAKRLGYLALALDHAATFMGNTGVSAAGYLRLYTTTSRLVTAPDGKHDATVAATWSLSLRKAAERAPGVEDVMRLVAMLSPDEIPSDLIPTHAGSLPRPLAALAASPTRYALALAALANFTLIKRHDTGFAIHRLVQASVRHEMEPAARETWLAAAITLLTDAYPAHVDDAVEWETCGRLTPHVLAAAEVENELLDQEPVDEALLRRARHGLSSLLHAVACFLMHRGSYDQSLIVMCQCVDFRRRVFGPGSLALAEALTRLAELRHRLADLDAALAAATEAQRILERSPSQDVELLLDNLVWLGNTYLELNRLGEASEVSRRAHEAGVETFGLRHPRVASVEDQLAIVLWRQGHLAQAHEMISSSLHTWRDAPGTRTLKIAAASRHLGMIERELAHDSGDQALLRQALGHYRAARDLITERYGEEHPDLPGILDGTGTVQLELGDWARGGTTLRQAHALAEKLFGARHPNTAAIAKALSRVLAHEGDLAGAIELAEGARETYAAVYGPRHPYVAEALAELGPLQQQSGQLPEARATLCEAIELFHAAYGPEHPRIPPLVAKLDAVEAVLASATGAPPLSGGPAPS